MNLNGEFTEANLDYLHADPDTARVFVGQLLKDVTLQKMYDKDPDWRDDTNIELEADDFVLITEHFDGTSYLNFLDWDSTRFHYRTLIDPDNPGVVSVIKEL